jgi:hypothetical protein
LKFLFNIIGTSLSLIISKLFNNKSVAYAAKLEEYEETMILSNSDWYSLLLSYGIGVILIYLVFFLLYKNALKFKNELELNELEIFETKVSLYSFMVMALIPVTSIILLEILPEENIGYAGMVYCLYGVIVPIYITLVDRKRLALGLTKPKQH